MVLISRKQQGAGDSMNLVASILYTAVTLLLWHLLRGVNSWIAAVAAVVSLLGCWLPLARYENAYPPLHITNFLFFGIDCLLIAYLILRAVAQAARSKNGPLVRLRHRNVLGVVALNHPGWIV